MESLACVAYNKLGTHGPREHAVWPHASGVCCVVCVLLSVTLSDRDACPDRAPMCHCCVWCRPRTLVNTAWIYEYKLAGIQHTTRLATMHQFCRWWTHASVAYCVVRTMTLHRQMEMQMPSYTKVNVLCRVKTTCVPHWNMITEGI